MRSAGRDPIKLHLDSAIANCLCKKHNSALSPLDQEAIDLQNAFRHLHELRVARQRLPDLRHTPPVVLRVNGPRLERWAFKTVASCATPLRRAIGDWAIPARLARAAFGVETVPDGAGLAILAAVGDRVGNAEAAGIDYGRRPKDAEPVASVIDLRAGYKFVISWEVPLQDFAGFNLDGQLYDAAESLLPHPRRIEFNAARRNLKLALEIDWGSADAPPSKPVARLRHKYKAPPRRS